MVNTQNQEERTSKKIAIFSGKAKVGEVIVDLTRVQLRPEDFSSPIALQMALSRIYEAVLKAFEKGFRKRYVAEIQFTDSLGNQVAFAVDLGDSPPPFSSKEVKARILVEIYEHEKD